MPLTMALASGLTPTLTEVCGITEQYMHKRYGGKGEWPLIAGHVLRWVVLRREGGHPPGTQPNPRPRVTTMMEGDTDARLLRAIETYVCLWIRRCCAAATEEPLLGATPRLPVLRFINWETAALDVTAVKPEKAMTCPPHPFHTCLLTHSLSTACRVRTGGP